MELDQARDNRHISNPICSVCIANFNGLEIIADCIDSVLSQTHSGPLEIIVHDDASTDASVDFIRSRYPQVTLLASETNVGFCTSNNRMVARARGKFVLLLNNDAQLFPDAIETLLEGAKKNEAPTISTLPQYDWLTGDLVDRGCMLDPIFTPTPNKDPHRNEVAYVIGACLWIPRETWNELGGFPDWIESIAEDLYLCLLARLNGYRVTAQSTSGYRHRQGASFGGNRVSNGKLNTTVRRRYLSERNRLLTLFVITPTAWMWPWLGICASALLLESVLAALYMRKPGLLSNPYGRAIRDCLTNVPKLTSVRSNIQSQRKIGLLGFLGCFDWRLAKLRLLRKHGMPKISG